MHAAYMKSCDDNTPWLSRFYSNPTVTFMKKTLHPNTETADIGTLAMLPIDRAKDEPVGPGGCAGTMTRTPSKKP
jgi:hypothetical protein